MLKFNRKKQHIKVKHNKPKLYVQYITFFSYTKLHISLYVFLKQTHKYTWNKTKQNNHTVQFDFSDNVPAILLDSRSLAANLFEGDVLAGLVPTLFADDPDAAERAITSDAAKAHWDINKINKVFMVPENIGLKDAVSLLKKPR